MTVIFGTIYVVSQQMLRMGANDPQIQFVEDFSRAISDGSNKPNDLNGLSKVDIDKSLQTFAVAYDKDGNITAGQANLDGKAPVIPKGVLEHANPQNRITWQPRPGVRIATVVQAYDNGYILAGRNMREIEKRENTVFELVAAGWLVAELGLTVFLVSKTKAHKNGLHAKIKKY